MWKGGRLVSLQLVHRVGECESVRGEKVRSCLQRLASHLGVGGQLGVRRRERLFSEVSFLSSKTSCHQVFLAIGYWY